MRIVLISCLHTYCHRLIAILFIAPGAAMMGHSATSATSATNAQSAQNASNFSSATQAVVTTDLVRAELLAYAPQGVAPGQTVWLGLQIKHQPNWHTYWKNPGDSGLPTTLSWTLPAGVSAGDIAWPLPRKIRVGPLANYGYDGTVLLPVPVTIATNFTPPAPGLSLSVKLHATWLACRQECVPESGDFALQVPLHGSTAMNAVEFEAAFAAAPRPMDGHGSITVQDHTLQLTLTGLPPALRGQTLELLAETQDVIETAASPAQAWQGSTWTASIPLSAQRQASPSNLTMVVAGTVKGLRTGWVTTAGITGTWPAVQTSNPHEAMADAATPPADAPPVLPPGSFSFWLALAAAFVGGLVLNLMPCVFPILAIKVLGLTQHAAHESALNTLRTRRMGGLAYAAGVVLSFIALGGLMLVLRSAGTQLGWGFQLQSPAVVAALAAWFSLMGLNLAGLFELGHFVPARLASLQAPHPVLNDFLSGLLAVLIASPCTAPFMGASLGLTLSLPAIDALLIFTSLGLGMATPYFAVASLPVLARCLPRPGAWMVTFRQLLSFLMFATVVWLVWILGQQSGVDAAAALLLLLLTLAWVVWAISLQGRSGRVITFIAIAIFALLTGTLGQYVVNDTNGPTAEVTPKLTHDRWQPWSAATVEQLLSTGTPVFVDFTAAWCITCQFNKKTTLSDPALLADFEAKHVTLLRADWTRHNPAITVAINALGRSGVPVYVLYRAGHAPVVLSEILTVRDVQQALGGL